MIEPESTEPPAGAAAGDRHADAGHADARQHCGPYWLDFYATSDAVVCVVTDDEMVSS